MMHPNARRFVAEQVGAHGPFARVLEIGSRDLNGSVRDLFDGAIYLGIDRVRGKGVDVLADGATYAHPHPFDAVVCCEVLEHSPKAADIVANMCRLTRPGGWVIVTCAGPGRGRHSGTMFPLLPQDYYENIAPYQLAAWLGGMEEMDVRYFVEWPECGDVYAVARRPT